jgi:integrase
VRPARKLSAVPAGQGAHDRLGAALDHVLLASVGWDDASETLAPDPAHPLLGYRLCTVLGCGLEARDKSGLCSSCRDRFTRAGEIDVEAFCAAGPERTTRSRDRLCLVCRVPGFSRPVGTNDLCSSCDGLRRRHGQSVEVYVSGDGEHPPARPRPSLGSCSVAACRRLAAHPGNSLCGAHDSAWRLASCPPLEGFRRSAAPCQGDRAGKVVLAGLDQAVIAEVLYALQAALAEGRQVMPATLRHVADHLRRTGAHSLAAAAVVAPARTPLRWFLAFGADRAGLVRADLDSERGKDVWDLRVFGRRGRLSFVGGGGSNRYEKMDKTRPIRQPWLKEAAKCWAAEALVSMTSGPVRAVVAAVGLLSEHLARREDGGLDPAALGHRDMEAFLVRLARLVRAGTLSAPHRDRTIHLVAKFLRDCREMGLSTPGRPLAALPDDVVIRRAERPRSTRRDDEVGLALPDVVMAQLLSAEALAALEALAGPTIRAAVELGAGVGRRTAELCSLRLACLDHDTHTGEDGERRSAPVLVHDMPKVAKVGCRLPIHEREADIIATQQQRVRASFSSTPVEQLVLFPRPLKNPRGIRPIGTAHVQRTMRAWVSALPRLDGPDRDSAGRPVPFPRERVNFYSFRHSFAQRHADAGTPVDTLKELLGHDTVRTTLGYYRVTAKRKRAAQDALGPLQISADARRVRPGDGLLPAEALREQVGQVAIPFGICTEPSNVQAAGGSCPFRHRCLGCEYFRTDPSYQPELRAYLSQLLADAERFAAAVPHLAEWARAEAAPCPEEIETLRRLILANEEVLGGLEEKDRRSVEVAIATARKGRAALDASFPVQFRGIVRQASPRLFPAIERESRHG